MKKIKNDPITTKNVHMTILLLLIICISRASGYSIKERKINFEIDKANFNNILVTELLTYLFSSKDILTLQDEEKYYHSIKQNLSNNYLNGLKSSTNSFTIKKSFFDDKDAKYQNIKISPINDELREIKVINQSRVKSYVKKSIKKSKKETNEIIIPLQELSLNIIPVQKVIYSKTLEEKSKNAKDEIKEFIFQLEFSYSVYYPDLISNLNKDIESQLKKVQQNKDNNNKIYNITLPISTFDDADQIESIAEISVKFKNFPNGVKIKANEKKKDDFIKGFNFYKNKIGSLNGNSNKIIENSFSLKNNMQENLVRPNSKNSNQNSYKFSLSLDNNSNKNLNFHIIEKVSDNLRKDQDAKQPKLRYTLSSKIETEIDFADSLNAKKQIDKESKADIKLKDKPNALELKNDSNGSKIQSIKEKNKEKSSAREKNIIKTPLEHIFALIYLLLLFVMCVLCFCITVWTNESKHQMLDD